MTSTESPEPGTLAGPERAGSSAARTGAGVGRLSSIAPADPAWFRSSATDTNTCVEVAFLSDNWVGVRDSEDPNNPPFAFAGDTWGAFIAGLKEGDFSPISAESPEPGTHAGSERSGVDAEASRPGLTAFADAKWLGTSAADIDTRERPGADVLANAKWSGSSATAARVEVAFLPDGWVGVRDSEDPNNPPFAFAKGSWDAFIIGVSRGEFDPR